MISKKTLALEKTSKATKGKSSVKPVGTNKSWTKEYVNDIAAKTQHKDFIQADAIFFLARLASAACKLPIP